MSRGEPELEGQAQPLACVCPGPRAECRVDVKAETGTGHLQAKGCRGGQQPPDAGQRRRTDAPSEAQKGPALPTSTCGFPASRTRDNMFLLLQAAGSWQLRGIYQVRVFRTPVVATSSVCLPVAPGFRVGEKRAFTGPWEL